MINQVLTLDQQSQRKIAAMIGAVVGDAACMHLQWIYDQDKIAEIVQAGQDPAFWNENHCPFFTLPTGKLTCFADEAVQSLNAMEANDCVFDENKIIEHFLDYFGTETSPYQMALENRKSKAYPIEGNENLCFDIWKLKCYQIFWFI